jgi:hypothetical protein
MRKSAGRLEDLIEVELFLCGSLVHSHMLQRAYSASD